MPNLPLAGRVAVVTGASRGIGRRIAEVLAGAGASVVLTARPGTDGHNRDLEAVVAGITESGARARAVLVDSSDATAVARLAQVVDREHGQLDILVNNAAMRLATKLLDTAPGELDQIFRVNVLGPFLTWRYLIPIMLRRGRGNVINLTSTNAPVQPFIGMGAYRMSKVALTYLSTDLAMELKPEGIAVNGFDPGPVVSDGTAAIREERHNRYGVAIAYHQLDPVDVLDAPILWLAQQTAASFTGRVVRRTEFGQVWGPAPATDDGVGTPK